MGEVTVEALKDSSLHDADPKKLTFYRRNDVGFVFQFYNLMPNLTAYENINLAAQISKSSLSIMELLEEVGLIIALSQSISTDMFVMPTDISVQSYLMGFVIKGVY